MERKDSFWIITFLLGFLFSFAVVGVPIGMGLFLFVNSLLAALLYFAKRNESARELEVTKESTFLKNTIVFFFVVLSVPYLYRMSVDVVATLVATHILLLLLGAWYFALPSVMHIVDVIMFILSPIIAGLTWIMESLKAIPNLFKDNSNIIKLIFKVIIYSALSLLIFVIFAKFLSDADPEFKERIDKIIEMLQLPEIMGRTVLGVFFTFVAAGLLSIVGFQSSLPLFGTKVEKAKERWASVFKLVMSKKSDALLPVIVTVPILLLFSVYVWVQFKYILGQDVASILERYTFAEYAHRGFIELLTVGVLTYPILGWSMNQARNEWKVPRYLAFLLNTGIVSLLVIMLYSLIVRMNVYMGTYGPSVLRMYVIVGAVFVGVAILAYEITSMFKLITPGYRFFVGKVFNDYSVLGLIIGLGLLTTLSIVPWSQITFNQIKAYYYETGKLDVFQVLELPDEVQPDVYAFAEELEKTDAKEGAMAFKANAQEVRNDYIESRDSSIFSSLFGFNFSGMRIMVNIPEDTELTAAYEYEMFLENRLDEIMSDYFKALQANDFTSARGLFDSSMEANDIISFADSTSISDADISKNIYRDGYVYVDSFASGYSKYINLDKTIDIVREREVMVKDDKGNIVEGEYTTIPYKTGSTLSINIGYRNGKLVIVNSNIILSYLPDAVVENPTDQYMVTDDYGYSSYCDIPTLEFIFAEDRKCPDTDNSDAYDSYYSNRSIYIPRLVDTNDEFVKSDFVTQAN